MNDINTPALPAVLDDDGFTPTISPDRVIIGAHLKCVDGHWSENDVELPTGSKLLALACDKILQNWENQKPIGQPIRSAPDGKSLIELRDEFNERIPESEWEEGINGPRPPWVLSYIVYLLDEQTAEKFTFANSTTGARIAFETLQDRVAWMRRLRGANVVPLVELTSKPMKTRYGVKQRPEFKILEWRNLSGGSFAAQLTKIEPQAIGKPVKPPSLSEDLDDEIPI
jgi:hypothetical protein